MLLLLLLLYLLRIDPYPDRTDREPFQNLTIELCCTEPYRGRKAARIKRKAANGRTIYLLRIDSYPDRTDFAKPCTL